MGITTSLLLVAIGAILIWAVDVSVSGIELVTIGWILLIVGAIGAVLSLIFWSSWGGYHRETRDEVVFANDLGSRTTRRGAASSAPFRVLRHGTRRKRRASWVPWRRQPQRPPSAR